MVKSPSKQTLNKYGIDLDQWLLILDRQGGVCAICRKLPSSGRLCVEHEHVKRWSKKPPEERSRYIRGLCCFQCNTQYLGRGISIEKARNVVSYLEAYGTRLANDCPPACDCTGPNPQYHVLPANDNHLSRDFIRQQAYNQPKGEPGLDFSKIWAEGCSCEAWCYCKKANNGL